MLAIVWPCYLSVPGTLPLRAPAKFPIRIKDLRAYCLSPVGGWVGSVKDTQFSPEMQWGSTRVGGWAASENLSLRLVLLLFVFPQNSEHTLFCHSESAVAPLTFSPDVFLVVPRVADVLILFGSFTSTLICWTCWCCWFCVGFSSDPYLALVVP